MNESQDTRAVPEEFLESLVGRVADEFLARQERGESPDPEEYAALHPHAADLIRRTLAALRLAADSRADVRASGAMEPELPEALGDFRIVREVGRGGMGVVYEAEQLSLHRRVALKVLPFAAVMDPRHLQRFHNEALAAAALDHPNVVKVYGVGCERGVHFIAMQLVDGRSLAELVRERRGESPCPTRPARRDPNATRTYPADTTDVGGGAGVAPASARTRGDGAYFRRVAEWGAKAAEALEHAHAMGVVHRDVKPANLLVDGRGELHVADFGLAKVASDSGVTGTGDLLGTLRYMSPEQANAKHDLVDHRSDVYSLGVTLYELLTLTPAFNGLDRQAVLTKVTSSDPAAPRQLDRLIPRDLETVVLKAMEKDPSRRYQSAKEFADDLRRYLANEPVWAKPPTLRERAIRWAGRRPRTMTALVALLVLSLGALAYWDRERTLVAVIAKQQADEAEAAAAQLADEAEGLLRAGRYLEALAVARRAEDRLPRTGDGRARDRVRSVAADATLAHGLDEARIAAAAVAADGSGFDNNAAVPLYREAFAGYGTDVLGGSEEQIATTLGRSLVRAEASAALWDWALVASGETRKRLLRLAEVTDPEPNPLVSQFRRVPITDKASLRELAAGLRAADVPPRWVGLIGQKLVAAGLYTEAKRVVQAAVAARPGDFWINHTLGAACSKLGPTYATEALRYWTAARALRPLSAGAQLNVGFALAELNRYDEAVACYREAIRLKPDYADAHINLGNALQTLGKPADAIACYREAIRLKPDDPEAHINLGNALRTLGEWADAIACYREAIRLKPNFAEAHYNLGHAFQDLGKPADAIACYREAIRLKPDYAEAHINLGNALQTLGKPADAIACCREALRLKPDYAEAHHSLGNALQTLGKPADAIACYRVALRLKPDYADTHHNLGVVFQDLGKPADAIACYREAIRLKPDFAGTHINLGNSLQEVGDLGGAEAAYREAFRLRPDYAEAHFNLGVLLRRQGLLQKSLDVYRRVHEIGSKRKGWPYPSALWVKQAEQLIELNEKLPDIAAGKARPADTTEALGLAETAFYHRWYATSARLFGDVLLLDRKPVVDGPRYYAACGAALAGCGRGEDPDQPSAAGRERLRDQSLRWLTAELTALTELGSRQETATQVLRLLRQWHQSPNLACVRDEAELKKLPETEQADWRKLWADVSKLQAVVEARAKAGKPALEVAPPPHSVPPLK